MNGTQWEYLIVQHCETLNALGLEGWELVSVVNVDGNLNHYLKRPAADFRQRMTEQQRHHVYAQLKSHSS